MGAELCFGPVARYIEGDWYYSSRALGVETLGNEQIIAIIFSDPIGPFDETCEAVLSFLLLHVSPIWIENENACIATQIRWKRTECELDCELWGQGSQRAPVYSRTILLCHANSNRQAESRDDRSQTA